MAITKCTIGSIGHDQIRRIVLWINTEFEDTYNMLMIQSRNRASFVEKAILLATCNFGMKYLDGCLCLEVYMLTKIYVSEATLPQQAVQTVVAKSLSNLISHTQTLLYY